MKCSEVNHKSCLAASDIRLNCTIVDKMVKNSDVHFCTKIMQFFLAYKTVWKYIELSDSHFNKVSFEVCIYCILLPNNTVCKFQINFLKLRQHSSIGKAYCARSVCTLALV